MTSSVPTSERELFEREMAGVRPLSRASVSRASSSRRPGGPTPAQLARRRAALRGTDLSLELQQFWPAHDPLAGARSGVQPGVYRKLRLGEYSADARLEILGLAPSAALDELRRFMAECRRLGIRTALVQHGRGPSDDAPGNRLRSYLAQWLPAMAEVQAFHSAPSAQGGLAATLLLLAKGEKARLHNRERLQKRQG